MLTIALDDIELVALRDFIAEHWNSFEGRVQAMGLDAEKIYQRLEASSHATPAREAP